MTRTAAALSLKIAQDARRATVRVLGVRKYILRRTYLCAQQWSTTGPLLIQ